MNLDKLDEVLKAVHSYQWAVLLAYPRVSERLSRPVPVELLRLLLDMVARQAPDALVGSHDGVRADYDPTRGFARARPIAAPLRSSMEGWDGSLPVPVKVMMTARDLVTAYGHDAVGRWEEHTVGDDFERFLLWPESPDVLEEPDQSAGTRPNGAA